MVKHNADTEDEDGGKLSSEDESTENEAEEVITEEEESSAEGLKPTSESRKSPHRTQRSARLPSELLDSPAANTRQSKNSKQDRTLQTPSPHSQCTIRTRSHTAVDSTEVRKSGKKRSAGSVLSNKGRTTRAQLKRKPASKSSGDSAGRINKKRKPSKRQKDFVLSSDKRKPDPLIMKRVAFNVRDNGDGESLLQHFGGLGNISHCLMNDKYLLGTIVGLSKGKRSPVCYDVEWEDTRLRKTTPVELPCIINGIELSRTVSRTVRRESLPSIPTNRHAASPSTKNRITELFGEELLGALLEVEEGEEGDPEPSDDEINEPDDDEDSSFTNDEKIFKATNFLLDPTPQNTVPGVDRFSWNPGEPLSTNENETESFFRWSSEDTLPPPPNISKRGDSRVKPEREGCFSSPILSLLAFIPFSMFKSITIYSNAYAHAVMKKSGKRTICGARWPADISINEMMKFFGLLFSMALRPTPGSPYTFCWSDPGWHPYTVHLSLRRFQQIRSVLHFNFTQLGDDRNKNRDALHKVRPLLNCLKLTFPLFLQLGDNFSLDEASVASRSRYGSDIIFYNPTKPGGKYHFRFYMMCCSTSYICIRLRMHTRNQSDFGDGFYETESGGKSGGDSDEESLDGGDNSPTASNKQRTDVQGPDTNNSQPVKKMVALVLDMCKPLFGTGSCVNMDNYYTSPEVAVALGRRDVFMRGTCRTNRLGFPAAVRFTNTEATNQGRGRMKRVVDVRNNLVAYGWVDGNPVHFLTSADGSNTSEVTRRIGKKKEKIKAPIGIKNYNKYMHAVDRHDQLRETFSLSKRHGFKKYYLKVAMGLLDMASVNAWLHYRLVHQDECEKKTARYDFMKSMAESLLLTNWNDFSYTKCARDNEDMFKLLVNGSSGNGTSNMQTVHGNVAASPGMFDDPRCHPLSVANFLGDRRKKRTGLSCQVCAFEGRGKGKIRSVVICLCHRIRVCTVPRQNNSEELSKLDDNSWRAPEGISCWSKAHSFYIPKGLFSDNPSTITPEEIAKLQEGKKINFQCVKTGSELYKKKTLVTRGMEGNVRKRLRKKGEQRGRRKKEEEEESESEEDTTSFKTARSEELENVPVEIVTLDDEIEDGGLVVTNEEWL